MKEASEAKTKQPPVPAAPSAESQAQAVTGETTAPEVKATKQQGASEREANIEYVTNMCKISLKIIKTNVFKQFCISQIKSWNVFMFYYTVSFLFRKKRGLMYMAFIISFLLLASRNQT